MSAVPDTLDDDADQRRIVADRLEGFIAAKAALVAEHPLRYLFWEATLRCNLSCRHCGSDCWRDDGSRDRELPPEAIKRELAAIAHRFDPRRITFAIIGGEPLVRPDIEEVGAFAAGLGFAWGITTNAMLLDAPRLASLKAAGLSTIAVSLDGLEDAHDALRRSKGAFRQVSAALERWVADPFYAAFDVICYVSTLNIDGLGRFVDHLAALGVPQVRLTPVFSRGRAGRDHQHTLSAGVDHSVFSRGRAGRDPDLALSGEQVRRLLAFVAEAREVRRDIVVTLSEEGYWGPNWECRIRDGLHYCGSGTTIGSILHDGAVTGCPSVSRRFTEGSVRDSAFLDLWERGFERFRHGRPAAAPAACGNCAHWELCEGGGFHLFDPEDAAAITCGLAKIGELGGCHD